MTFKEKLNTCGFLVTSEIGPPKGISLDNILKEIAPLKNRLDAINVTDLQSSCLRMGSLAASIILKKNGFEPILQMTCRDKNRLALQAEALSAAAFGIENILALTGDHTSLGDHPGSMPVYDLDVVQFIQALSKLRLGLDLNDNPLTGEPPAYTIGAVVNPGADPLEPEIIKMEKKIESGVEFFQTQAVFDVKKFEDFLKSVKHLKTKIIAGIVPLKSERMAKYLNDRVPGLKVPDPAVREIAEAPDKKEKSIEMSIRLIRELKGKVNGIHLMPIGWYDVLPPILDSIGA
ncbi:MAG TPA: methylenetetrahydrofolate reductase [Candidatus Omnitrophota bacterium]|nr:methylenetetrahydrofolate reductase [Candidatus Omnitrophota bacterium]